MYDVRCFLSIKLNEHMSVQAFGAKLFRYRSARSTELIVAVCCFLHILFIDKQKAEKSADICFG